MNNKSSREIVYNKIKEKILNCEYQPGQLISEKDIVEELNTSRTPVRKALNRLKGEGLIDIIPKKGIQVSQLSIKKVKEIYEIRKVLEPLSIKDAIKYVQPENIDNLNKIDEKLADSIEKENVIELFAAGMDYHLYLAELSHNETLLLHLKMLREESYRSLVYYLLNYIKFYSPEEKRKFLNLVGGQHFNITKALEKKDEEDAISALLEDLTVMDSIIDNFSTYK